MDTVMLKTFVVAALNGSVSNTAKQLRYSESTVLYHIREIEKACRAQLFVRQIRGLDLTLSGQAALNVSQRLLRVVTELEAVHSNPAGRRTSVQVPVAASSTPRTGPVPLMNRQVQPQRDRA